MSFDFEEAFISGLAEWGGTFDRSHLGIAWIGPPGRRLMIVWGSDEGRFRASAPTPSAPLLEFGCAVDGWEEWQAKDAGRDFAKRAYEIAGRLGK